MKSSCDNQLRVFKSAAAIVTGGASGIGEALCRELATRGAHVVVADIDIPKASRVAESIRAAGGAAEVCELDVRRPEAVAALVIQTAEKYGRLDFMFNNAGSGITGDFENFQLEHWTRILDLNLMGAIHGMLAAYPLMKKQGFGHIVNTSSMGGLLPFPMNASYTASKYAIYGISRGARIEGMDSGVRVSVICPGVIKTPLLAPRDDRTPGYIIPPEEAEKAWKRLAPMDPGKFAIQTLDQVGRNRAVIIVPGWWKLFWLIERLSPSLMSFAFKKLFYDVAQKDMKQFAIKETGE